MEVGYRPKVHSQIRKVSRYDFRDSSPHINSAVYKMRQGCSPVYPPVCPTPGVGSLSSTHSCKSEPGLWSVGSRTRCANIIDSVRESCPHQNYPHVFFPEAYSGISAGTPCETSFLNLCCNTGISRETSETY